jgi:hypothetical protein
MTLGALRATMLAAVAVLALSPMSMAQQRRAQPPQSVRLYVFDCGQLNIADISVYLPAQARGDRDEPDVGSVFSDRASQRESDVGCGRGS